MSRPRSKARLVVWIIVAVLVCALAGGAVYGVMEWYIPYRDAQNTMLPGEMTIREQEDGSLLLSWPEGRNADTYTLEVINSQGGVLYGYTTAQTQCVLPNLRRDTQLTLQVSSNANWRDRVRPGDMALRVNTVLEPPKVTNLIWKADPDTDIVQIRFDDRSDTHYHMYPSWCSDVLELASGETELSFGEGADYPLPAFDETYSISFDAVRQTPGLTYYGLVSASMELCREDFLGTVLNLNNNDLGNNAWQLFWNETKGDHYEVQQWDGIQWQTIATVEQEELLTYYTGHLEKFEQFSFRVIAVGGQATDIFSEPLNVVTGAAAVYCTIWPQRELDIYADETRTEVLGKAAAAKAYCVLEEKDGLFGIRFEDRVGYIDSNYCMINLPEYMEDLCYYEITNSHHSIYMVHDYEIPEVTDTVIKGYEHVNLGYNKYLVPLLYPAAKKLVAAANAAREQGYVLKIYDSYRPYKATKDIYERTEKIMDDPIPLWTFKEKKERLEAGLPLEPPTEPTTEPPQTESTEPPTGETEQETTEDILTYEKLMTDNGRYYLGNFLAPSISTHNLGIALDLTMVGPYGEEVEMQTAIHDLSWFSEVKENNREAKRLRQIMTDAGFATLSSEWWHFQDSEARSSLGLTALHNGVNAECWMADDDGWRYRCRDGSYYKNCRKVIDGVTYLFDENGYVTEE